MKLYRVIEGANMSVEPVTCCASPVVLAPSLGWLDLRLAMCSLSTSASL